MDNELTNIMSNNYNTIEVTNKNTIAYNILSSIKDKVSSWIYTLRQLIDFLLGGLVASETIKNEEFSKKLTDIFIDTEVEVYVYISNDMNVFTLPELSINSSPIIVRFMSFIYGNVALRALLMTLLGLSRSASTLITANVLMRLFNIIIINSELKSSNISESAFNDIPDIDPKTKKVVIYISSKLIQYINDDDQLIALMLYEIGYHLQKVYIILQELYHFSRYILLSYAISIIANNEKSINISAITITLGLISVFMTFGFIGKFLFKYINNEQATYSTEFISKTQYKESFELAKEKIINFKSLLKQKTTLNQDTIIDSMLTFFSKILKILIGKTEYINKNEEIYLFGNI